MEAAENNHLDAVKYLIKAGALVDPKVCLLPGRIPVSLDMSQRQRGQSVWERRQEPVTH